MTTEQIKALADAAMKRINDWIARSAGQHIRAMKAGKRLK